MTENRRRGYPILAVSVVALVLAAVMVSFDALGAGLMFFVGGFLGGVAAMYLDPPGRSHP